MFRVSLRVSPNTLVLEEPDQVLMFLFTHHWQIAVLLLVMLRTLTQAPLALALLLC